MIVFINSNPNIETMAPQRKANRQLRILHVISGLATGGAEAMLFKLVKAHKERHISSRVICLRQDGSMVPYFREIGVEVICLGIEPDKLMSIIRVFRLAKILWSYRPDVIHGWMYHGNLAALIASLLMIPRPRLCWNIRQTIDSLVFEKSMTRKVIQLNAFVSRIPDRIFYNSQVSAEQHEKLRFKSGSRIVIPNGFDLTRFKPSLQCRDQGLRGELGLFEDTILVGHIARFHQKKDHDNFLLAATRVIQDYPEVKFIAAGWHINRENTVLMERIKHLGLEKTVLCLGERRDIPRLMSVLDVFVSSARSGEGFPNTIGEAMASGVPCVVTDVGESANIVGNWGRVVVPNNSGLLAAAIIDVLSLSPQDRHIWGQKCRERIARKYAIGNVSEEYRQIYDSLCSSGRV